MATDEEIAQLREASNEAATQAEALLDDDIGAVMKEAGQIDKLKPATADEETYCKLIKVIQEATAQNQSIADLKANIMALGDSAVILFREMSRIARLG
ncbi:MAG TPA: hypothetical protein PLK99_06015 [Burkholderiales bacterium]|nr:hypothetical protein [Burkholderiales bacterium]